MATTAKHCMVVGAGIVGSSCAWYLRRAGMDVTLVDSESPGQMTSYGNAGCISPSSVFPFSYPGAIRHVPGWLMDPLGPMRIRWSHLARVAPWMYRFWRAGTHEMVKHVAAAQHRMMSTVTSDYDFVLQSIGAESLRRADGLMLLYGSEDELRADQMHYDLRDQFGIPWQRLTNEELASMEPDVRIGQGVAVLDPTWQHLLSPGDVTSSIAQSAIEDGATWIQDRVTRVDENAQGVTVTTLSGKKLHADFLVVAAGVWSNALLEQLGTRVPLAPKRGYHSMLSQPNRQVNRPLMQVSEYVVITPMRDGLRVAGTAEFADVDARPDYRRARAVLQHAQRFLPGLEGSEVKEWMGQRPMMPDSMPVIGPVPGHPRALCAFGHGHYGITQGPTTGRIISDLVCGQSPHIDISPFAADRF